VSRWGIPDGVTEGFADAYIAAIPLIVFNVLWFVTSLLIITLLPATGALYYATSYVAHGKGADWRTFFEGFRAHFWLSWRWGLLNVFIFAVLGSNLLFYGAQVDMAWAKLAQTVVLVLLVIWGILQLYTFPLLLEQADVRLRTALRNSVVIVIKRPVATVLLIAEVAIIVGLSTFVIQPAWIFISASLCAYLANRAVISSIRSITGKAEQPI
jgi:uncharacterized membrane protein YesL